MPPPLKPVDTSAYVMKLSNHVYCSNLRCDAAGVGVAGHPQATVFEGLLLIRIARTRIEFELGGELPVQIDEGRLVLCRDQVILQEFEGTQIDPTAVMASLIQIEATDRPIDRVIEQLALQAQLLGPLPVPDSIV